MIGRVDWWSWVPSKEDASERREHAGRLAGQRLSSVRYATIDYGQPERAADARGPRVISSDAEMAAPVWRCETFDWADYGVEFTTTEGRVFTVSWDRPGLHEGIWIREVPSRGSAFEEDADVAIWDVSAAGRWDRYVGQVIGDVQMHYRPGASGDGYWCSRITLLVEHSPVHMLLGDQGDGQQLVPAADNIAVVFPPNPLPEWERYDQSTARPQSSW